MLQVKTFPLANNGQNSLHVNVFCVNLCHPYCRICLFPCRPSASKPQQKSRAKTWVFRVAHETNGLSLHNFSTSAPTCKQQATIKTRYKPILYHQRLFSLPHANCPEWLLLNVKCWTSIDDGSQCHVRSVKPEKVAYCWRQIVAKCDCGHVVQVWK